MGGMSSEIHFSDMSFYELTHHVKNLLEAHCERNITRMEAEIYVYCKLNVC